MHRPNRHHHLVEAGRLGQVHVGTGIHHRGEHVRREPARHHQQARLRAPAQDPDQLDAVHAGQHQVEDVEVERERRGVRQQLVAVGEGLDFDVEPSQVSRQVLAVLGVVIHQRQGAGQG